MSQESEASVDNNSFMNVLKVVEHIPQSIYEGIIFASFDCFEKNFWEIKVS